jgi:hypothetical protein
MSTVLFNPTNEDFEAQYIGETTIIPAGKKLKVDDRRARHILNVLGPRGLMSLDYGDEGEKEKMKADLGRRRNYEFKKKQVLRFNQQNQQRELSRLPYQSPSEQIAGYADEVGIALVQPYRPESEQSEKIGKLTQELKDSHARLVEKDEDIKTLQGQVADLTDKMQSFMDMMSKGAAPEAETPIEEEVEEKEADQDEIDKIIKGQYSGLSKFKFQDWVIANWDTIPSYSDEIQADIAKMWKKFFSEDLPDLKPKADKAKK